MPLVIKAIKINKISIFCLFKQNNYIFLFKVNFRDVLQIMKKKIYFAIQNIFLYTEGTVPMGISQKIGNSL